MVANATVDFSGKVPVITEQVIGGGVSTATYIKVDFAGKYRLCGCSNYETDWLPPKKFPSYLKLAYDRLYSRLKAVPVQLTVKRLIGNSEVVNTEHKCTIGDIVGIIQENDVIGWSAQER